MGAEGESFKEARPRFKRAKTQWRDVILVCSKCSKKIKGGFGPKGKDSLVKAMRKAWKLKKGRKAELGVIQVGCLKVCPKGAVTVMRGALPKAFHIIPANTPLDEVAQALGVETKSPD